jgi:hypothetical protein
MGVLQRLEDRLEQLVSGAFARVFRSAVQPVELAAALQREVDSSAQILSRDRRLVPNTFAVELSPADYDRLAPYGSTLSDELTDILRDHADDQSYVFTGPVSISFERTPELSTGRFHVRSAATAKVTAAFEPESTDWAVRRSGAVLEVNGVAHPLDPPGLLIGRGTEAELRINDPGVSRRHAEIRVAPGDRVPQVSIVDLGSTNGLMVDGRRVEHAHLGDGSTVKIGNTTMTVRYVAHEGQGDV